MTGASARLDYMQRVRQQEKLNVPLFVATLEGVKTPEQVLLEQERVQQLDRFIDRLPPRTGLAVRYHYGIRCEPMTVDKVAERFDRSKERVRQIVAGGVRKLRYWMLREEKPKLLREVIEREQQEQRAKNRANDEKCRLEQEADRVRQEEWNAAHAVELERQRIVARAAFMREYRKQEAERAERIFNWAWVEAHHLNAMWDDELLRRQDEQRLQAAMAEQRRQEVVGSAG